MYTAILEVTLGYKRYENVPRIDPEPRTKRVVQIVVL